MHFAIYLSVLPLLVQTSTALGLKQHPRDSHQHLRHAAVKQVYNDVVRRGEEFEVYEIQRSAKIEATTPKVKKLVRKKKRGGCTATTTSATPSTVTASTSMLEAEASTASSTDPSSTSTLDAQASTASSTDPSSSSTTSAAQSSASSGTDTSNTASPGGAGSLLAMLFPVGSASASWTTSTEASSALSFSGALKPLSSGHLPDTSTSPDGSSALIANFPSGTVDISSTSGFNFYSPGSQNSVNVQGAKEVMLSYSVFFQSGFQFNKGGKMPGLFGGTSLSEALSCSGGRQDGRDSCFSARLMWRTNGMGEFYNYYPTSITQGGSYCSTPPLSVCSPTYGDSIGRGSFTWPTGEWITVAQRLKLNDVGSSNGEQELFVNGVSTLSLSGLQIAVDGSTQIYGIMAQTFFGGHDSTWASPQDQSAWFKDWSLAVLS